MKKIWIIIVSSLIILSVATLILILNQKVQNILQKDPCEATYEEIKSAINWAGEAQKLGLDSTAEALMTWSKTAYRDWAAEKSKTASEKERYDMAAEAQKLGDDKLADDLMNGRQISTECKKEWSGTLDMVHQITPNNPTHLNFSFDVQKGQVSGSDWHPSR